MAKCPRCGNTEYIIPKCNKCGFNEESDVYKGSREQFNETEGGTGER